MSLEICRICGSKENLKHVFREGTDELLDKIRLCANIHIDAVDSLPKFVCNACEHGLDFSYRLRKRGEETEKMLRQELLGPTKREHSTSVEDDEKGDAVNGGIDEANEELWIKEEHNEHFDEESIDHVKEETSPMKQSCDETEDWLTMPDEDISDTDEIIVNGSVGHIKVEPMIDQGESCSSMIEELDQTDSQNNKMSSGQQLSDDGIEKFLMICEDYEFDSEDGVQEDLGCTLNEENIETEDANERDSDSSSSEDIYNSDDEDKLLRNKTGIIEFTRTLLRGKNNHKWSSKRGKSHRYGMNVGYQARGPTGPCKNITDPLKCFQLFITDEIISEVVQWTNAEIYLRKNNLVSSTSQTRETDLDEIKALIGILCLTAVSKSNHLTSDELFDASYSGSRYVSTMTKARFKVLLACLCFNDKAVRLRICNDKFAPIRNIWEMFTQKCRQNYTPGSYLTIDEQLLAFRGKCAFRMYVPNKPAKYGLKMLMLCDSGTKYMVDAMPFLGKDSNSSNPPLSEFYVKELTKQVHGSNRNVTMGNWFTSVNLAKSLLLQPYKLTIVGTLRSNKREIPKEMKNQKGRKCQTSMFCYDNELTLLSYKPKQSKTIFLLSSCNEEGTINPTSKKPHMLEFYNQTKGGGVGTFDQMCSVMSCSRKTNRWPMCQFYGMLNMAFINSYVIYTHNMFDSKQNPLNRREFMKKLHCDLVERSMSRRLETATLTTAIRSKIENVLAEFQGKEQDKTEELKVQKKRKICGFCPCSKRRMTKSSCYKCKKSICGEHKIEVCTSCI